MIRNSKISVISLSLIGFLLSFAIMYTYGYSMKFVYGVMELIIAAFCYIGYIVRFRRIDVKLRTLCLVVVGVAWFTGLVSGDLKSTLLITVPLIMPLYISTINIEYKGSADFRPVTIAAVTITFLAIIRNMFGYFNSNTLGFIGFMGVSFGFLWVKNARFKMIPIMFVLFGILCAAMSGSRNVALIGLVCGILLILPDSVLCKRIVYFSITGFILIYTIFSADIMAWGFSVPQINDFLLEFTGNYSQKAWQMAARVE